MSPRIVVVPSVVRWLADTLFPLLGFLGTLPAVSEWVPWGSVLWWGLLGGASLLTFLGYAMVRWLKQIPGYQLIGDANQSIYVEDGRYLGRFIQNLGLGSVIGLLGGWLATVWDWAGWAIAIGCTLIALRAIIRRLQMRTMVRYDGQRLISPADGVSVEIPAGWEHRQVFGVLGLIDNGAIANLAPAGRTWPNIEVTSIGDVGETDVHETQRFAHYFCGKRSWPILSERFLTVGGLDAYEVCYRQAAGVETLGVEGVVICKVSILRGREEFLIQMGTDNLPRDKPALDACVQSVRFLSPTT